MWFCAEDALLVLCACVDVWFGVGVACRECHINGGQMPRLGVGSHSPPACVMGLCRAATLCLVQVAQICGACCSTHAAAVVGDAACVWCELYRVCDESRM
jgi:hypothetical protein